jgi:hypothetical protein
VIYQLNIIETNFILGWTTLFEHFYKIFAVSKRTIQPCVIFPDHLVVSHGCIVIQAQNASKCSHSVSCDKQKTALVCFLSGNITRARKPLMWYFLSKKHMSAVFLFYQSRQTRPLCKCCITVISMMLVAHGWEFQNHDEVLSSVLKLSNHAKKKCQNSSCEASLLHRNLTWTLYAFSVHSRHWNVHS